MNLNKSIITSFSLLRLSSWDDDDEYNRGSNNGEQENGSSCGNDQICPTGVASLFSINIDGFSTTNDAAVQWVCRVKTHRRSTGKRQFVLFYRLRCFIV